jgi:hypothetical protein
VCLDLEGDELDLFIVLVDGKLLRAAYVADSKKLIPGDQSRRDEKLSCGFWRGERSFARAQCMRPYIYKMGDGGHLCLPSPSLHSAIM